MYKYIVYCSVSAAIIIASKYLYQHWIKQNHIISTLKQDIGLLTDKVKRLEAEMEKRAHVYSGGVHIPIEFVKSSSSSTNKPNTIILLKDDVSSAHSSSSSSSSSSGSSGFSLPPPPPAASSPQPSSASSVQKSLDICDQKKQPVQVQEKQEQEEEKKQEQEEEKKDEKEEKKKDEEEEEEDSTTVLSLISNSNGKERRRKKLPDAKQYTNGTKFKDEEDQCEYLCVVGKRGGHSWKKI